MRVSPNSTIRQIALHVPGSIDLFHEEGIDLGSGAEQTLEEACVHADLSLDYLCRRLELLAEEASDRSARNWHREPLFVITSHIVNVHHAYARHEMPRLAQTALTLSRTYGATCPELARVEVLLRAMIREFSVHMLAEEQTIFPYIAQLEAAELENQRPPQSPSGTDESPLRNMMAEHDSAVEMLRELRYLTNEFNPPVEGDLQLERFYSALDAFEADMQDHIELEDNVLFPRALELELSGRPQLSLRGNEL
jgi:regulator of cell morphogenesis and NO signaling